MTNNVLPMSNLESVVLGYLLNALEVADTYAPVQEATLPDCTIYVKNRGAALSVTTAAAPLFRNAVASLTIETCYDVVLVRIANRDEDFIRTTVDLILGLLPGAAPWPMSGLEPWVSHHRGLWLVPPAFGPAVSVNADGVLLAAVPPYQTMAQRSAGVLRAAGELASLMPAIARVR